MITLLLADAEMEWYRSGDRTILLDRYRGGPEDLLTDTRRGRPDVVHSFLNMSLRSPLRGKGLEVMVHTRQDKLLIFGQDASVPADYLQFLQLLDPLMRNGSIGEGEAAIRLLDASFEKVVDGRNVLVFSPQGRRSDLSKVLKSKEEGWTAVIGGFTEGDFLSPVYQRADEVVSLGGELLTVPLVLCQALNALE